VYGVCITKDSIEAVEHVPGRSMERLARTAWWQAAEYRLEESAADPKAGGVNQSSGDDESANARGVRVSRDWLVGQEVQVAHDGIVTDTAQVFELAQADVAKFGMATT